MNIVLTGHSGGIGSAIHERLEARGHKVYGVSLPFYDVSERQAVMRFWRDYAGPCDALINCAGKYGAIGPLAETNVHQWWATLAVNLLGTVMMCQAAIPYLSQAEHPKIINFGGAGKDPLPNYSAYAASKSAVVRFTECLAQELQPRIKVYAFAPGFQATDFHKATLQAGNRAGRILDYTRQKLASDSHGIEHVVGAIEAILAPSFDEPVGSLILAQNRKVAA